MKKGLKVLVVLLCAVMLVAASVMGTLAYLTAQDSVENTFTVGNIEIKLDEAVVDKETGKATTGRTEDGNTGVKIIPGRTLDKDPTVYVKEGSEKAFVRMKVTISHYSELKAIFGDNFLPQDYVTGWDPAVWVTTKVVKEEGNTATYEFRYNGIVEAPADNNDGNKDYKKLDALFTTFTLPGAEVDNKELATLKGLSISVTAEAIQAETFENDENKAWDAFDKQYNPVTP